MSIEASRASLFEEPLRILSDLHLGHPGSRVGSAEALRPVLEGAKTVVFNGDTREMRAKRFVGDSDRMFGELEGMLEEMGIEGRYLTGNHDHRVSEEHYLDLCGGEVFVTHGHAVFPEVSPWSFTSRADHEVCLREYERLYREYDGDTLDGRMRVAAAVCELTPKFNRRARRGLMGNLKTIINVTMPPRRTFSVLNTWRRHHVMARDFCRQYRPGARFILMGHTHLPGVRSYGDLVVINTGGYISWGGARYVEVAEGELRVVAVKRDGAGRFLPGRVLRRVGLGEREIEGGGALMGEAELVGGGR
ncbi:MAG: metallophosphoesterase [Verrucomicrobiota bacterium]